jgi:hypothetical protein
LTTSEPRNGGLRVPAAGMAAGVRDSAIRTTGVSAKAVATGATGDPAVRGTSRAVCCDAVGSTVAWREAPDNHTAEPPTTTPHANALTVIVESDVRAAISVTTGRTCDITDAIRALDAPSRHVGSCHLGRRNSGSRDAGSRHAGSRHAGSRHAGSRHAGSRHAGRRNAGSRHAGRRHAGKRHRGRRKPRRKDTADAHAATANRTTRRDAATMTAKNRTSDAIVRTANRRPSAETPRLRRTRTVFWCSEGKSPNGSSGDSGVSLTKMLSGGNGIRVAERGGIAQVAPSYLFQPA